MSHLGYSWNLKSELEEMEMSSEIREEVNKFIELYDNDNTGKIQCFGNLFYRSNLQYIINNIKNPNLLSELKALNKKCIEKLGEVNVKLFQKR